MFHFTLIVWHNIKKLMIVMIAFTWIMQPCLAAAKHKTTSKKHHTHQIKKSHKKVVHHKKRPHAAPKITHVANRQPAVLPEITSTPTKFSRLFGGIEPIEHRLVEFVHKTLTTLSYSAYQLGGTRFNLERGIYILDCSTYVDNILQTVYPHAYSNLVTSTGSDKPTTQHYYDFITRLPDNGKTYWNKIDEVGELRPGDIIVFRYKNSLGNETGGHVMIVMDTPILDEDAFLVRVADSAPAGHSKDTRERHVSGIGVGTLVLKQNPQTGQPSAYAWKVGSRWQHNVKFAMGRPMDAR